MKLTKFLNTRILFNLLLFISFSISVNTFVGLNYVNTIFYVFFHLVFIYFLFYYYHFTIYFIAFFYGILFDIFLLNQIGVHLLTFLLFISAFVLLKQYLKQLSSYQIAIIIFFSLFVLLISELIIAYFFNNYLFNFQFFIQIFIISIIIFIPSILLFNKIDNY